MSDSMLKPLAIVFLSLAVVGSLTSCAHPASGPSVPDPSTTAASPLHSQPDSPGSIFDTNCGAVFPQTALTEAFGFAVPARGYELISPDVSAIGGALLVQSGALICQWGSWSSTDGHLALISAMDGERSEFERNRANGPGIARELTGKDYEGFAHCAPWLEHAGESTYSCTINIYRNDIWIVGRFDGLPGTAVHVRPGSSPGSPDLAGLKESAQLVRLLVDGASIVGDAPRLPRFDPGPAALKVPKTCNEIKAAVPLRKAFTWEGSITGSGNSAVYTGEGQFRLAIDRSGALQCVGETPLPTSSQLTVTVLPAGEWAVKGARLPQAALAPAPELGASGLFACPPSDDGGGSCSLRFSEAGSLVSIELYGTTQLENDRQTMIALAQAVLKAMRG